jgi:hypothetical protein
MALKETVSPRRSRLSYIFRHKGQSYQCRDDEPFWRPRFHSSQPQGIEPQDCGDGAYSTYHSDRNTWIPTQWSIQRICDGHDEV